MNTTVQRVEDMVKEHWVNISSASAASHSEYSDVIQFAEAIKEEPDFFLLAGYVDPDPLSITSLMTEFRHMPVARTDHWPTVFDAIRAVHPTTPIMILGGKACSETVEFRD